MIIEAKQPGVLPMLNSIAVTTDFSPFSRKPFGAAAELARRFGARLYLVHFVREPETSACTVGTVPRDTRTRQAVARRRLLELSASEAAFEGLEVCSQAIRGEPARALSEFQKREGIDLVVVASHGHTGADYYPLKSFAARLLRTVSCPLLVFRHPEITSAEPWPFLCPRRILVPYDFSRAAPSGLAVALEWAREFGALLRLIFVVEVGECEHWNGNGRFRKFFEEIRSEAQNELDRTVTRDCAGVRTEAVVRIAHPAREILKEAADFHADLVVMVSRGRSALDRLNSGSVGERTVLGGHCPILLVKHRG